MPRQEPTPNRTRLWTAGLLGSALATSACISTESGVLDATEGCEELESEIDVKASSN